MNIKRFFIAVLAVFVILQALGYLIHNVILIPDYQANQSLWRQNMQSFMWLFQVTSLIFSFAFVYVFVRGYENRGIGEGLRYGLVIWFLVTVPGIGGQYMVYPIPLALSLKWLFLALGEWLIAGVVISLIYKPVEQ